MTSFISWPAINLSKEGTSNRLQRLDITFHITITMAISLIITGFVIVSKGAGGGDVVIYLTGICALFSSFYGLGLAGEIHDPTKHFSLISLIFTCAFCVLIAWIIVHFWRRAVLIIYTSAVLAGSLVITIWSYQAEKGMLPQTLFGLMTWISALVIIYLIVNAKDREQVNLSLLGVGITIAIVYLVPCLIALAL